MQIFFISVYALQFMHIDKRLSAWNHMEKPQTVCSLSRDPYVKKKICGLCSLCFMWSGNFGQQTLFVAPDTKSHRLLMCVLCPTRTNSWWVFFCQNCTNCWCMVSCPKHKDCWCVLFCPNAECHFFVHYWPCSICKHHFIWSVYDIWIWKQYILSFMGNWKILAQMRISAIHKRLFCIFGNRMTNSNKHVRQTKNQNKGRLEVLQSYWGRQFFLKSKSRLQIHLMWIATTPPLIERVV